MFNIVAAFAVDREYLYAFICIYMRLYVFSCVFLTFLCVFYTFICVSISFLCDIKRFEFVLCVFDVFYTFLREF